VSALISIIVGAVLGFIGSIASNIITGQLLSTVSWFKCAKFLSKCQWRQDPIFDDDWGVSWDVTRNGTIEHFSDQNVRLYNFLTLLAFQATFKMNSGDEKYYFVGFCKNNIISGRWYDPRSDKAYHGQFQVWINGVLDEMNGKWIGWSVSGAV
jgi:hypothetical protein